MIDKPANDNDPPVARAAGDAEACGAAAENQPFPARLTEGPQDQKSPAEWAYQRLIHYLKNFEETLDENHEVAMGFVSGGAGIMRIQAVGFFAPDLITFYGVDEGGTKTQLVQHVSQLNMTLKAAPKLSSTPMRIGFALGQDLDDAPTPVTSPEA